MISAGPVTGDMVGYARFTAQTSLPSAACSTTVPARLLSEDGFDDGLPSRFSLVTISRARVT